MKEYPDNAIYGIPWEELGGFQEEANEVQKDNVIDSREPIDYEHYE